MMLQTDSWAMKQHLRNDEVTDTHLLITSTDPFQGQLIVVG